MDYFIAIFTKNKEYLNFIKDKNLIILDDDNEIIDSYQAKDNIFFDYLITDDLETLRKLNVIIDDNIALTNFDLQTSIENVFAFGKAINSSLSIEKQLEQIYQFIFEN